MIVACHREGRGWKFWGDSNLKSKFWGRSIQLDPVGFLTLEFDDGEVFQWSKVTTFVFYQSSITKTWIVPFQEIIDMDDGIYEAVAGSDFVITRVAFRDNSSK
ncbi:oxysterol-binding protein-related protein 1B-like [Magnolia sinica]|uniref:oxysterol-binding protein-related protein 1B-like n=1 Tax=Magnolia sinica TaxID=86752 RepID=UPI0026590882|nr:oxysterol-binding protein-related protein 1B-like [Magnolia sinica]